jgi:hypothetical protein
LRQSTDDVIFRSLAEAKSGLLPASLAEGERAMADETADGSEGKSASAGSPDGESPPSAAGAKALTESAAIEDDPKVFILSRELSEVHLLLDNLSADPDTTIEALAARQPPKGLDENWIDQICRISWPPADSNMEKAAQASLLIRVKDFLNRLARPASGMSIAFTIMVTQKDEETQPPAAERKPGVDIDETLWRSSLAEIAYPDLKHRAAAFRKWLWWINIFVVVWLVVTCFLSWHVAFGNSALAEYKAAQDRLVAAQKAVDGLESGRQQAAAAAAAGEETAKAPAPSETQSGATAASTVTVVMADPEVGYCQRWRLVEPAVAVTGQRLRRYENAAQLQACRELEEARRQVRVAEKRPRGWLWVWNWALGVGEDGGEAAAAAARLANILGTAVLPVFYGLLGAAAAVLRSQSQKIKASTLTPRDLSLSLQQLALGAVVGACIGLFIVGADTTLIGPVTLSGSAISFIAGFGVEAVFQALEALISRIFNLAPAGAGRAVNNPP